MKHKYNRLKEVCAQHHEQAQKLINDAKIQDENTWECPMCWGEGTVECCAESSVITVGEMDCAGVQLFGIGDGVNDIQILLGHLLTLSPKMFEVIDAAMKVVDVGKSELPELFDAVAALREE
jgi:hypothetical protein